MKVTTFVTDSRLKLPGVSKGIVVRIRSTKSPAVRPFQLERNSPPASGGAVSPPDKTAP